MPKQQVAHLSVRGLQTQYNPYQVQPGALLEADNCVVDREGMVSKRRGFDRYGDELSNTAKSFMDFKNRAILFDGTNLWYDSDGAGAWSSWSGTYSPADSSTRIRGVESRSNLYFTTSKGIYKNDALTNSPGLAGMPKGLDTAVSIVGSGGWFLPDTQVAYRIVWTRKDANDFLVAGAPSTRETIANARADVVIDWAGGLAIVTHAAHGYMTGDLVEIANSVETSSVSSYEGTFEITVLDANTYLYDVLSQPTDLVNVAAQAGKLGNTSLTFTIPEDVVAGDSYEVYRTAMSATAGTDPGDRHFLLKSTEVTASDITAGTITFSDTFNESFLGVELNTNPTQDTILKANDRPPWAKDVTEFKGHAFYLNTKREQRLEVQLISLATLVSGSTVVLSDGTNTLTLTAGTTENIATGTFAENTTALTSAEQIELTAKSLIRVVNRSSSNSTWVAYYVSSAIDAPGKILFKSRSYDALQFSITGSAGSAFSPDIPVSGTNLSSSNDARVNRLYRSKFEQPDAVPETNFDDVGSEESEGLRILALRDSLLVLKEEGVWRLSGDSESSFLLSPLDPSVKLIAPESAVILDNAAYCLSTQGVVKINENGTSIVSRDIEKDLVKVFNTPGFKTIVHAEGYETDRKYLMWAPSSSSSSTADICWCYNYLTQSWTRWTKPATAAMVLFNNDLLYIGHTVDKYVLQERKSFNTSDEDYQDETIAVTASSPTTTTNAKGETVSVITVLYTYAGASLSRGMLFSQGALEFSVESFVDNGSGSYTLTLDSHSPSLAAIASTVSIPISSRVRWAPITGDNPGLTKRFSEASVYLEDDRTTHHQLGFASDVRPAERPVNEIVVTPTTGWGQSPWGDAAWGDDSVGGSASVRSHVPRQCQRARSLHLVYEHAWAKEDFHIVQASIIYRPVGERVMRAR